MGRRYCTTHRIDLRQMFTTALLRLLWVLVASVSVGLHQPVEASGQSMTQLQIDDAPSETSPSPASTTAATQLSQLVNKGDWKETSALAQERSRQEPGDATGWYYLGLAAMHFHDPIGAIKGLRKAEGLGLDIAYLHQALGIAYYNLHQFILFQQQMERSIALAPEDYKPYFYMGQFFESIRNDFPGAREYFAKATRLQPAHTGSWYHEGYCLEVSGQRIEARGAYETAIKSLKETHERFSLPDQGIARLLADDAPAEALEFAHKAIELEPNLSSNHLVIAKIYEKLGRLSEAKDELRTAERLDPTSASTHFMLARIYSKAGDREAAEAEIELFKQVNRIYGSQ